MRSGLSRQHGFTLIEVLIVIIVIGILAAIAIPMCVGQRDKAKQSALTLNARHLIITAHSYVADGLGTTWKTSSAKTNGTLSAQAATYVSCALEENIKMGGASGTNSVGYKNPYSGKTLVLNQSGPPATSNVQPVLWITQSSSTTYRYAGFPTNATTQAALAGCVVVCWNTTTKQIEIFSVDKNGKKSATCCYMPM